MKENLKQIKQILAKQLTQLREDKNISLQELSQILKINQKWLTRAENGKANIEWYYILKLATFYNKDIQIKFTTKKG